MAKKSKNSKGSSKGYFSFDWGKGSGLDYVAVLKVFAIAVVLAGIGVGFYFVEGFVKEAPNVGHYITGLKFESPKWVGQELLGKIKLGATGNQKQILINESLAAQTAFNLQKIAWIYNVRVVIDGSTIDVGCQWRKPVALFRAGDKDVFVASDLTVLDHVAGLSLPIVELRGIGAATAPAVGQVWERDDVAAAITLLGQLETMDEMQTKDKPLLYHIAAVDVGNFGNRKAKNMPQIVLFAKDGTNVNWGAPLGQSSKYFEATDEEKLAMLYDYYKSHGRLSGLDVKYIELRIPQGQVPTPTLN
ncbi:MAG: hypothetical protein A2Y07_02965 [Planctomycetes bacterium GWF2_50_10]|nr:MAG: hypothetical protein A2Y07_02965 [Planctomycetes bacterium GWF2_50_10]